MADVGSKAKTPCKYIPLELLVVEIYNGTNRSTHVKTQKECQKCQYVHGKNETCSSCGGSGMVVVKKTIVIPIKKGTLNQQKITFIGEGDQFKGMLPGDIVFKVEITEDQTDKFILRGTDMIVRQTVHLKDCFHELKAWIETPQSPGYKFLEATRSLGDEVVYNGRQFSIPNQGLPDYFDETRKGNLTVEIKIKFPKITFTQNELRQLFEFYESFNIHTLDVKDAKGNPAQIFELEEFDVSNELITNKSLNNEPAIKQRIDFKKQFGKNKVHVIIETRRPKRNRLQQVISEAMAKISKFGRPKQHFLKNDSEAIAIRQPSRKVVRRKTKRVSEAIAKESEAIAKESKTIAKDSETIAKDSETIAKDSETIAKDSKTIAKDSKTIAKDSEANAKDSEANAKYSEAIAKALEIISNASEMTAKVSESFEKNFKTIKKDSEPIGKISEDIAKDSKAIGKTSKTAKDFKTIAKYQETIDKDS